MGCACWLHVRKTFILLQKVLNRNVRFVFCVTVPDIAWECGDQLTNTTGWIRSVDGNGDGLYENNIDCTWIIKAPDFYILEFTVLSMNIEPDVICSYDYLKVIT